MNVASQVSVAILEADRERTAALRKSLAREREKTESAQRELADARRQAKTNPPATTTRTPERIEHRRVVDVDARTLIRLLTRRGIRALRQRLPDKRRRR